MALSSPLHKCNNVTKKKKKKHTLLFKESFSNARISLQEELLSHKEPGSLGCRNEPRVMTDREVEGAEM